MGDSLRWREEQVARGQPPGQPHCQHRWIEEKTLINNATWRECLECHQVWRGWYETEEPRQPER